METIYWQYKDLNKPNGILVITGSLYVYFYINQAKTSCIDIHIGSAKNYRKKLSKINTGSIPDDFPKKDIIKKLFTRLKLDDSL